jgi:hypothetical protein
MADRTPYSKTELPDSILAQGFTEDETLDSVYDRVYNDVMVALPLFTSSWEESRRNSAYVQGRQWSEEDIRAFGKQNRIPYVFDQISPKVNAILGVHASRRVEASVLPSEPSDEKTAFVATRLARWCEQVNRMDEIEREVFHDMIVKKAGVTVTRWELSDTLSGRPVVERVPIYQMLWDPNSADSSLSDAKWMARIIPMLRQDAIERWPEYTEEIMSSGTNEISTVVDRDSVMTPRQRAASYSSQRYWEQDVRGEVMVVEHYEKIKHYVYVVVDPIAGELHEYDSESTAKSHLDGLYSQYLDSDVTLIDEEGNDLIDIVTLTKDIVVQSLIIGDQCVMREVTDLPDYPYQVAFCYHDDGEYWSFVDQLIDPQMFQNRMISELDNQIGRGNKNLMTVIAAKLSKGWSIEHVNAEKSKTSGTIPVHSHDAINIVPNTSVQPGLVESISMAINHMTDIVGGRNALGLQENAAESGAAVRARQEAAGMARMPVFAHVNSWRRKVTEMCLWYMRKYLAPDQQMRILGADGSPEWLLVSSETLDSLANARMDVVITEAVDTVTAKERQFVQLKELFQTIGPALPPDVIIKTMLEYSSIESKTKDDILGMMPAIQEYYKQQSEEAKMAKLQQSAEDSVLRAEMKKQIETQRAVSAMQPTANPTLGGIQSTP